jgi:hypothetical protein
MIVAIFVQEEPFDGGERHHLGSVKCADSFALVDESELADLFDGLYQKWLETQGYSIESSSLFINWLIDTDSRFSEAEDMRCIDLEL